MHDDDHDTIERSMEQRCVLNFDRSSKTTNDQNASRRGRSQILLDYFLIESKRREEIVELFREHRVFHPVREEIRNGSLIIDLLGSTLSKERKRKDKSILKFDRAVSTLTFDQIT